MIRIKWKDLGTAVIIILVASAVRVIFFKDLGRAIPYLTYYPAIMIAGAVGGFSAGILSTIPSFFLCYYWIQQGYMNRVEWLAMLFYLLSCIMISILTELMHRARNRAMQAKKQILDVIDFLPDPTLVVNKENQVIIWNKAIEKMTGIPASEIIGKSDYLYAIPFYGEKRPILIDYIFMENADFESKYPGICREGDTFTAEMFCKALYNNKGAWLVAKASLLHDSFGNILGAIETIRDITDQRAAMEQERIMIHQSRMATMGEMINNIAHQWRQPLNTLSILLYNFKDAFKFNEMDETWLNQNIAAGNCLIQKMSTTIDDFRNFFRPDKNIKVFSVLENIKEAVALMELSFQHNDISIHIDAPHDLTLSGFPNEYSQVLLNLLSNAKEAMLAHNTTISGRVDIIAAEENGQGRVSIRDNGGGIPEDILERIFDPYFTTKEKGSGIGLYMSKIIIERNMHGSLTVKNVDGGAEFRVSVPLAKSDPT